MATYSSREIDSRRIEYTVPAAQPWGATRTDMYQGLMAAEARYRTVHGLKDSESLSDDALRVLPSDDEVIISFTVEKPAPPDLPMYKASSVSAAIAHVLGTEYNATRPIGEMADAITARLRKSMPHLNIRDDEPSPVRPSPPARCDEMTHNSVGSETFCRLKLDHDGDHDNTNGLEWPRED